MAKKKATKDTGMVGKHVIVTTDKDRRGVFFGKLVVGDVGGICELTGARMVVYWHKATHGVLGLAATGPADGSRIGPVVPCIRVDGVTSITACTKAAVKRFGEEIWNP